MGLKCPYVLPASILPRGPEIGGLTCAQKLTRSQLNLPHGTKQKSNEETKNKLEMWANAQRDGRPAKYRWRPLLNAAKFG